MDGKRFVFGGIGSGGKLFDAMFITHVQLQHAQCFLYVGKLGHDTVACFCQFGQFIAHSVFKH